MPIYEYKCQKCGKQFEAFKGISDPEVKSCKFCKGKVQKIVSLSSFSLKGSGWYVTDYKGKNLRQRQKQKNRKSTGILQQKETPKEESFIRKTSTEE